MEVYPRREPIVEDSATYFRAPIASHVTYTNILGFKGGISLPLPAIIKGRAEIIKGKNDVEIICEVGEIKEALNDGIEKFKEYLGVEFGISIHVEIPSEIFQCLKNHTIASVIISTLNVINFLLRRPLDFRGLRLFIMDLGRRVHSGYALLIQDGSMAVSVLYNAISITTGGEILVSRRMPGGIYGIIVKLSERGVGKYPIKEMIEGELIDKSAKLSFILENLYPALANFDINVFGDKLATLHFLGSKFAELYAYRLMDTVATLRGMINSGSIALYAVPSFSRVALLISDRHPVEHPFSEIYVGKYTNFSYFDIASEK